MWICKECGGEITIKAIVQGLYRVFLNKNKEIKDYDDWEELYLPNGKVIVAICDECGKWCTNIDNLEEIAFWED